MKIKWINFAIVLFLVAISSAYEYDNLSLSNQGTDVRLISNGSLVNNGDLTILVWDDNSILVYNTTFTSAIINGSWNLMMENLSLNFNGKYWMDYAINGENIDFDGADRLAFNSPLGVVNNSDLAVNVNLSNATGYLYSNLIGAPLPNDKIWLNTTTQTYLNSSYPNYVNISNTLFVNGTNKFVGVGTTAPSVFLEVIAPNEEGLVARFAGNFDGDDVAIEVKNTANGFVTVNFNNATTRQGNFAYDIAGKQFLFDNVVGSSMLLRTDAYKTRLKIESYGTKADKYGLVTVRSILKLEPINGAIVPLCNSTTTAYIFYNSSRNEPCFCNSTAWRQMDGGTVLDGGFC